MPRLNAGRENATFKDLTDAGVLNRGFELAHAIYLHRPADRRIALEILWEALRGVQVRLTAQQEADRHEPERPTKVRWSTIQWLQLLVYLKSEQFEKKQEAEGLVCEDDMIIRYIKHLLLITCRRNSFHICLGVCRLLYNYSAGETMAVYDMVFQDPDSSTKKSDAYYRARKNKLIEELELRFADFLRVCHGVRGEKRFESRLPSESIMKLTFESLTRFIPWGTQCELPRELDPWTAVNALQSSQTSQIHSLIDPNCLSILTKALKLPSPDKRLSLPRFHMLDDGGQDGPGYGTSSQGGLQDDEIAELKSRLLDQSDRRRKFVPDHLRILADGVQCAQLDLARSGVVRFDIEESVSLMEVWGSANGREVILANHVFSSLDETDSQVFRIRLEGGQEISLSISSSPESSTSFVGQLSYRETMPLRILSSWWRGRQGTDESLPKSKLLPAAAWGVAVVLVSVVIVAALYWGFSTKTELPQDLAKQGAPANEQPQVKITPGTPVSPNPRVSPTLEAPNTLAVRSPRVQARHPARAITREQSLASSTSLLSIKNIYIEPLGKDSFSQAVQKEVVDRLISQKRFSIVNNPDDADTALTKGSHADGGLVIEMVNPSGEVIWRSRRFSGTAPSIASRLVESLVRSIEAEERSMSTKPQQ